MAVEVYESTLLGGVTPTCNRCGQRLCWDISEEEYAGDRQFWDNWICKECNNGTEFNKRFYQSMKWNKN